MANITNLITNIYPIAVLGLQLLKWLIGIGALVWFLIMFKYFAHVTRDITLFHYKNNKSSCKYSDNPIWLRHFFARGGIQIFTPWRKYNRSIEKWKESFDVANNELSSRVNEIEKYKSPTDDDTREFIESEDTLISVVEKIVPKDLNGDLQTDKIKIKKDSDGKCTIQCGNRLVAYSYSYDKAKKIEKTLRDIIEDENVKELLKKRYIDYQEMSRLKQLFKTKLANFVSFMRRWDSILSFEKAKYPEDVNVK